MTKKKDPKDYKKIGRPPKIDSACLEKLRHALALGETDENACIYARINPTTFYEYLKRDPDFAEERKQLKLNPILKAKNTIYKSLSDPKVAMWYLERKRKDEFSTKIEQDVRNLGIQKIYVTKDDEKEANKLIDELIGGNDSNEVQSEKDRD